MLYISQFFSVRAVPGNVRGCMASRIGSIVATIYFVDMIQDRPIMRHILLSCND